MGERRRVGWREGSTEGGKERERKGGRDARWRNVLCGKVGGGGWREE